MNEKLNHKKAFTVVELVIVIAIIAVLAAVLIPTFAGLIHSANVSSDKSLVKNLNTALRADEVLNGSNSNIDRALGVSLENGYNIEKLTPTSQGNEIVWDEVNNQFALIKGDQVLYADNESKAQKALSAKTNIWKLITVENVDQVPKDGYSYYLKGDNLTGTANVIAGLSVGKNTGVDVKYERTEGEKHNVQFFTNGGDLTVNAPHDDVKHYGAVNALKVDAVNSVHCYHEYGYVGDLVSLGEGKFIAEEGSEFHQTQALIEAVLHGKTADISKAKFDQHSYGENDRCSHCGNLNPSHVHTWELEESGNTNTGTLKFKCGCGDQYTVDIPSTDDPNGHTKKHVPANDPTCTKSGNTEYWICSCGKFYESENADEDDDIPATSVILSAKGHQAGSPAVNETAANCTKAGERKITVKCTVCGEQLAEKSFPIPALGHNFDESTHKCKTCEITDPSWNPVSEKVKNGVLEAYAFEGVTTITEAVIPEGVTTIGSKAFKGCTNLKKVTIPGSVQNIGEYTFQDCTSLEKVIISEGVTTIGFAMFHGCSKLNSVKIPDNVKKIGQAAFYGCKALTSIKIPDTVTEIASGAFQGCSSLQSITIPDKVKIIDGKTFYECTNLKTVDLPNGLTTIVENAFVNCTSLTSITIPDTVTSIGMSAFSGCTGLTEITLPNVTSIGDGAFSDCSNLTTVNIGAGVNNINGKAFNKTSITTITVSAGNANYKSVDNCVLTKDGKTLVLGCNTIPSGVVYIGPYAFYGRQNITNITIGDNVKSIGKEAFSGSSLTSAKFITSTGWKADKDIDFRNLNDNVKAAYCLKGTYYTTTGQYFNYYMYTWTRQ